MTRSLSLLKIIDSQMDDVSHNISMGDTLTFEDRIKTRITRRLPGALVEILCDRCEFITPAWTTTKTRENYVFGVRKASSWSQATFWSFRQKKVRGESADPILELDVMLRVGKNYPDGCPDKALDGVALVLRRNVIFNTNIMFTPPNLYTIRLNRLPKNAFAI